MDAKLSELLKNMSIFSRLDSKDREIVISLSNTMVLEDGHEIFNVGEPSSQLYIILEGKVAIRRGEYDNELDVIAWFLTGDIFGELDFFTAEPRTASAVTIGRTKLLAFPNHSTDLTDFSAKWPSVSAHLYHSFLAHISSRIRHANTMVKENSPLVRSLRQQAYVDKLTDLYNKTYFDELLQNALKEHDTVGLLMFKPDNFKLINDEHGHEAGDSVLKFIGEKLKPIIPNPDMLFRYSGNEFAVILPSAIRQQLKEYAGTMSHCIRNLDISPVTGDENFRISVSFGLVLYPEHGDNIDVLVKTAHELVMQGREIGGNITSLPEENIKEL